MSEIDFYKEQLRYRGLSYNIDLQPEFLDIVGMDNEEDEDEDYV